MGNQKNKKSRQGKLGGANSVASMSAASGQSRGEFLGESSKAVGAKSGSKRKSGVDDVGQSMPHSI